MARITTTITAEFDPPTTEEQGEYDIRFDAEVSVSEDFPPYIEPQGVVVQAVTGFLSRIADHPLPVDPVDPELDAEGPTPESLTDDTVL